MNCTPGVSIATAEIVEKMFQSSPDLLAGCTLSQLVLHPLSLLFQSSPGLLAGCTLLPVYVAQLEEKFQSSPGLLAGCNVKF